ncbi:MAG: four helix bundle protein [Flavobacteriaceae bacterium]|nr:four helix bundle protein [Flavobacteriaceae bacterium]
MKRFTSFEEIESWKRSRIFNKKIYEVTNTPRFDKDLSLKRQIRSASVSISSNIAEGFERNTDKDFSRFLYIAKASAGEVRSQLYLSYDLGYIDEITFNDLKREIVEISKIIGGLIKFLNKTV